MPRRRRHRKRPARRQKTRKPRHWPSCCPIPPSGSRRWPTSRVTRWPATSTT
jgi:hypothetical protein